MTRWSRREIERKLERMEDPDGDGPPFEDVFMEELRRAHGEGSWDLTEEEFDDVRDRAWRRASENRRGGR